MDEMKFKVKVAEKNSTPLLEKWGFTGSDFLSPLPADDMPLGVHLIAQDIQFFLGGRMNDPPFRDILLLFPPGFFLQGEPRNSQSLLPYFFNSGRIFSK